MNLTHILHRKSCAKHEINTNVNNLIMLATLCGIIIITQQVALVVEGRVHDYTKQVALVPLTAEKVYQLLSQNHNLNAVPESRIVTQGIAAATGFTLGLKKALGAVFLYDIITANITEDDAPNATQQPVYLTQEICFTARNARSLYEAEAIAEAYSHLDERDDTLKPAVRKSLEKRVTKPIRQRRKKITKKRKHSRPQRIKVIRQSTQTGTVNPPSLAVDNSADVAQTETSMPAAATATATGGLEETNINNNLNTDTTLSTTTSTDNDKTLTCIVLQKPKL